VPNPLTRRRLLIVVALAVAAAAVVAVRYTRSPSVRPNVILVSIDTLRADHLGCYGYRRPTTPHLDAFRRQAVLVRELIAHAPSTLPAHASMFTSLVPQHHGASHTHEVPLPEQAVTLAEVLRGNGYRTAGVVASGQMVRAYGLGQGFDSYEELPAELPFAATVRRGLSILDQRRAGPFFLFLHSYEVHHPYDPEREHLALIDPAYAEGPLPSFSPEELWALSQGQVPAETLQRIVDAYDAEIRSMDEGFGELIAELSERGLLRDTVVAFTSDHGEELGEHGYVGWHSHTLYDELLRIPLLIRLAGGKRGGTLVDGTVRQIDLAPTLLALAGVPAPPAFQGRDLLPLIGRRSGFVLPAVLARERMPHETGVFWGIRAAGWKLQPAGLFDLDADPAEVVDLRATRPDVVERLQRALDEEVASRKPYVGGKVILDEEAVESLRSLGYAR
jgi:arylsulfatase A-like enzyme